MATKQYTLKVTDVGRDSIKAFGTRLYGAGWFFRVPASAVGRRVYWKSGDMFAHLESMACFKARKKAR
jgi:hypothetical protein